MPRWNGNDLPPSPRNTHGGLDNGHVILLYYFRMKFQIIWWVRLGDMLPLKYVQIRRERARYAVVHRDVKSAQVTGSYRPWLKAKTLHLRLNGSGCWIITTILLK